MFSSRRLFLVAVSTVALFVAPSFVTHGFATTPSPREVHAGACTDPYTGRVGFDTHLLWQSPAYIAQQLNTLRAAGVTWIRSDFPWEQIGANGPTENWSLTDQLMSAAAQAGIHVLAIVDYSAPWASSDPSGQGNKFYAPNQAAFAQYAADIAARYGDNGTFWAQNPSLPKVPLGGEEIWNEPFGYWFWAPNPDPATYGKLAYASAVAIHAVDPGMTVLASGDLLADRSNGTSFPWLATLLQDEPQLPSVINGWSVHPYPAPATLSPLNSTAPDYSFTRVKLIHQLLVNRRATKPIWLTEFGWSTATDSPYGVTPQQQSLYLTEGLKMATETWGSFVARSFLYVWDPSTGVAGDYQGNFGLINADGSTKPAWAAIQQEISTEQCGAQAEADAATVSPRQRATAAIKTTRSAHRAAATTTRRERNAASQTTRRRRRGHHA